LTKPWLFVLLGVALQTSLSVIKSGQGSLFVIGATGTSIVLGADSLVTDNGVRVRNTNKLIPLSDTGVCFIGGLSLIYATDNGNTKNWTLRE